jgi:hypothetical protein
VEIVESLPLTGRGKFKFVEQLLEEGGEPVGGPP